MYSNPLRVGAAALAAVICAPGLITQAAAADISSIKPGVANVGQTVRLKSGTTVPAGARLAVDLRVGAGKRVRLKAKRVAGKRIAVSLTKALGKLMVGNTDVTRVRLRLVVNGKPGRWSRRALLVPGSGGSPGSGGGSNDGSPGGGGGGGGGAPGTDAPPNPSPSLGIPVVRDSDFSYLGSFAMPIDSGCGGWETAWPSAGLSLRRVDGDLRFFGGAHVYSGGLVYETNYPGVSRNVGAWPEASVVSAHCDVYRGRKRLGAAPEDFGENNQTHGLFWDERTSRLYWSFGEIYNSDYSNDSVLGYSTLGPGAFSRGPWRTAADGTHSQRIRGGTLGIPDWFADAYLGGRNLGIGFGGYYSIIEPGSMGPTLYAIASPGDRDTIEPFPLIYHPANFAFASIWANRPTNYSIHATVSDWSLPPSGGRGYWAPGDSIEGSAVWIDEAEKHGLLYFTTLNTGEIGYGGGSLWSGGVQPTWYIYDPADLAAVALGYRQPWQVEPSEMTAHSYPTTGDPQGPLSGAMRRVAGAAYDTVSNTLFILQLNARQSDWRQTPLVHAFQLNGVS